MRSSLGMSSIFSTLKIYSTVILSIRQTYSLSGSFVRINHAYLGVGSDVSYPSSSWEKTALCGQLLYEI